MLNIYRFEEDLDDAGDKRICSFAHKCGGGCVHSIPHEHTNACLGTCNRFIDSRSRKCISVREDMRRNNNV